MTTLNALTITPLPVERLRPNPWNPNALTEAEFSALVNEVRRLNRVPKPVIVRPRGEDYEIVDGEHGWRAAREIGLTEINCEIIEVDDFEAMLQTYKRNQHGQHSPVAEGRMFRRMSEEKGQSSRELARAIGVSEGTVRNRMLYADSADLRNRYAGESRDPEIDALQIRQVRAYCDLPAPLGDLWLDAGGRLGLLERGIDLRPRRLGLLLIDHGLIDHLDPEDFAGSFARLGELAEWLVQHEDVAGVDEFVQVIAAMRLPALLAWAIPVRQLDDHREIAVDVEEWRDILECIDAADGPPEEIVIEVAAEIIETLEDAGISPAEVFDGPLIAYAETLLEMPPFLRDAGSLSLAERAQLHHATAPVPTAVIDTARQQTVAQLTEERLAEPATGADRRGAAYVHGVFLTQVRIALEADGQASAAVPVDQPQEDLHLPDLNHWCGHLQNARVSGRPALDVMRERFEELRPPEKTLVRALFRGTLPPVAAGCWLEAILTEAATPTTADAESR